MKTIHEITTVVTFQIKSLTCRNRQINLMPGTPSCWENAWRVTMATKSDWWHIFLVVGGDCKVVGTQALGDCCWTNDWWLHWVNSFQFHTNFKSMHSWLEMFLSLDVREIKCKYQQFKHDNFKKTKHIVQNSLRPETWSSRLKVWVTWSLSFESWVLTNKVFSFA